MMANILRRLRVSLLVLCLWAGAAVPAAAQQTDSLRRDSVPDVPVSLPAGEAAFRTEPGVVPVADRLRAAASSDSVPTYRFVSPRLGPQRPYAVHPSPLFRGDYSAGGVMGRAGGGFVVGAGSQESVPGIGRFNAAALGWQRQLNDRLQLTLMVDALKINTQRFTGQSFGLSGQLLYQASDRVYFRTFGGVGTYDNFAGRPAYGFGGTVGWDITERFGVEVGAQTYFNSLTGRWEVMPVMAPYYKFDRFKLQIDLGPLLQELIRGAIQKHRGGARGGNPTIMPDVPGFRH